MPPADHFPARLRQLREAAGLTQAQLAAAAGVRQATVSDLENGKQTPTVSTLSDLAEALDVEFLALFDPAE